MHPPHAQHTSGYLTFDTYLKYLQPYIRRLVAAKPRTYLLQSANPRSFSICDISGLWFACMQRLQTAWPWLSRPSFQLMSSSSMMIPLPIYRGQFCLPSLGAGGMAACDKLRGRMAAAAETGSSHSLDLLLEVVSHKH